MKLRKLSPDLPNAFIFAKVQLCFVVRPVCPAGIGSATGNAAQLAQGSKQFNLSMLFFGPPQDESYSHACSHVSSVTLG